MKESSGHTERREGTPHGRAGEACAENEGQGKHDAQKWGGGEKEHDEQARVTAYATVRGAQDGDQASAGAQGKDAPVLALRG